MFLRWTERKLARARMGETNRVSYRPPLVLWRPNEDSEWRQDVSHSANLVTCRRIDGKPRQLHLHTFGPISDSMLESEHHRREFWRRVERVLNRWMATPQEVERIVRELEARVPRPGPSQAEQQARRVVEIMAGITAE